MSDINNVRACAPFSSHFVNVLGSNLHYVDEGAGDPILFLHGNGCSSYIWRNIIPHMKSTGRCIALDLVGMGMSDKPDIAYRFVDHVRYVEGFIDAMKLRNITLVLHDWGAPLGFHYAMRNQDNIKGLAFFADAMLTPIRGWDQFLPEHKALFQAFRSPDTGWDMAVNQNMFMEKVIPAGIARKLSKEEMDCYLAPFRDPGSRKPLAQGASHRRRSRGCYAPRRGIWRCPRAFRPAQAFDVRHVASAIESSADVGDRERTGRREDESSCRLVREPSQGFDGKKHWCWDSLRTGRQSAGNQQCAT